MDCIITFLQNHVKIWSGSIYTAIFAAITTGLQQGVLIKIYAESCLNERHIKSNIFNYIVGKYYNHPRGLIIGILYDVTVA